MPHSAEDGGCVDAIFEAIRAIVTEGVVRRRLENLAIRIAGPAKKRI